MTDPRFATLSAQDTYLDSGDTIFGAFNVFIEDDPGASVFTLMYFENNTWKTYYKNGVEFQMTQRDILVIESRCEMRWRVYCKDYSGGVPVRVGIAKCKIC